MPGEVCVATFHQLEQAEGYIFIVDRRYDDDLTLGEVFLTLATLFNRSGSVLWAPRRAGRFGDCFWDRNLTRCGR
jgi:hypothetical protein